MSKCPKSPTGEHIPLAGQRGVPCYYCRRYFHPEEVNNEPWVEWIEPFGPKNEPVYCRVPRSTAIAHTRAAVPTGAVDTRNDEEAFEDFKVVHWAWDCDPPFREIK